MQVIIMQELKNLMRKKQLEATYEADITRWSELEEIKEQ